MTLTSMKITDFLSLLGSAEPAPGGGSAAALASSMGAALSAMVAHLTIGKKKYEEHDSLNREALEQLEAVLAQLERTIDEDTERLMAYLLCSLCRKKPMKKRQRAVKQCKKR